MKAAKHIAIKRCFSALLLCACAVPAWAQQTPPSWSDVCYVGFDSDIAKLAGPNATDCGFHVGSATDTGPALRCALKAARAGKPFKIGTSGFGTDSSYCIAAVRDTTGKLWKFTVDSDVLEMSGGGTTLWVSRCAHLRPMRKRSMPFFSLDDCIEDEEMTERIINGASNNVDSDHENSDDSEESEAHNIRKKLSKSLKAHDSQYLGTAASTSRLHASIPPTTL